MERLLKSIIVVFLFLIGLSTYAFDLEKAKEAMPFLNSDYAFQYLRIQKNLMNGQPIGETRTETKYTDDGLISSIVTTTNGEKTLELIDYEYGDRTRNYKSNTYLNGQLFSNSTFHDTFGDDFYRNMTTSDNITNQMGKPGKVHMEFTYDEEGRIVGMKQYQDDKLQIEQKDYCWTPNSCEYLSITYFPIPSNDHVKKSFQDTNYVQNILEIHEIEMNGTKTDSKSEFTYDDKGNMTSMKNFSNGQLLTEWKDYIWGDKKSSHKEIMYLNGNVISESLVEEFYK